MPATAPLRHLKECRQRKCNTGEIPHATLRKSICIFEEKVLAKNIPQGIPVGVLWRGVGRQHDFGVDDFAFMGIVFLSLVGGRRNG